MMPSNDDFLSNSNLSTWRHTNQNVPSPRQDPLRNETLIFVHVGKAAGETIQWRIKLSCKLRRSKVLKDECIRQFAGEESSLSKATIGYLHCDKLRPRESIYNATTFMFSLRNPVDRIVSWYQYMHPNNCFADRPSAACNLKKDSNPWGIAFYRNCFPDVNDFARSVGKELIVQGINCSALALQTVWGEGPAGTTSELRKVVQGSKRLFTVFLTYVSFLPWFDKGPSNHMHYNYAYYINRTIAKYPGRKILAVRQEFLWDDLRTVEFFLGGDPRHPFQAEGPTITHGSERFRYRANLDPTLISRLCCSIPKEIKAYTLLIELSMNLGVTEKSTSLNALFRGCRASSLVDLASRCGWDPLWLLGD